jgi:hypothetical protein
MHCIYCVSVSLIVCVALCAAFCFCVVCHFMWYVYLCVVSYCSTTVTRQNPIYNANK